MAGALVHELGGKRSKWMPASCSFTPRRLRWRRVSSLRCYTHAGRQSWSGPVALGDWEQLSQQLLALRRVNPILAEYCKNAVLFALQMYERPPELVDLLKTSGS